MTNSRRRGLVTSKAFSNGLLQKENMLRLYLAQHFFYFFLAHYILEKSVYITVIYLIQELPALHTSLN